MSSFDDFLPDDNGKAVCTFDLITLQDQKIKSNNYHFLCVGCLINILVLFLLQHPNWIERYSTMKSDVSFLLSIYTIPPGLLLSCSSEDQYKPFHCLAWQHSVAVSDHKYL